MSDADLVGQLATDVFERHCSAEVVASAEGGWSADLWKALAETGLTRVGIDEQHGGSGGIAEVAAVLRAAGRYAAPVPLAESTLIAGALAAEAGLDLPDGPVTLAPPATAKVEVERSGTSWIIRGSATRVPWARESAAIVVATMIGEAHFIGVVPEGRCRIERGLNLAREPRDTVHFDAIDIGGAGIETQVRRGPTVRAALARAIQMAGALERIRDLTIEYAKVRQQFGRSISQFQAVQHQLAVLAGEAAAAAAAVDRAVLAVAAAPGSLGEAVNSCSAEVAAAKVRAGAAASEGSRIAHQLHGAIGVTYEHQLHHFTSRLWSWRDEFGGERQWAARLGRAVAKQGGAGYWDWLTKEPARVEA